MRKAEIQRLREGLVADAASARERPDCPPADTLWAAATGEISGAELGQVVDHLADCPACVEAWRLARAVNDGEATARPARRFLAPVASIAAGLLLVLGLRFLDGRESRPVEVAEFRDGVASPLAMQSPRQLPASAFLIKWRGPEGAVYTLRLRNGAGDVLLEERGIKQGEYLVSPEALESQEQGSDLLCTIEASPVGREEAIRATFKIRLLVAGQ